MRDFQNDLHYAFQLHNTGHVFEAIKIYSDILRLEPKNAYVLLLAGTAYCQLGKHLDGLPFIQSASLAEPNNPFILYNLGRVLADLNRLSESRLAFEKAISAQPDFAEAYSNLGNVFCDLKLLDEALSCHQKALSLNSNQPEFHNNLGGTLKHLGKFEDSLSSFESAIRSNPEYAEAWSNRGAVFQELKMFDEALADHNRAIALKPDYAEAYSNRGIVLQELKRLDEALADYKTALQFKSDIKFLLGAMLHTKMFLCEWDSFESNCENLKSKIQDSVTACQPFDIQGLIDAAELQNKCAQTYIASKYPLRSNPSPQLPHNKQQKIKIGYFSSDFGNHPVTHLLAGLFECHDRERFEITAFSLEERELDEWRNRVIKGVDRFAEVSNKTDAEIAALSRSLGIDIAIDLNGHTKSARTGIFAHRAAPIQASYIGFLGTMGASYFDYLIADPILIPEESRDFYTESIAYLPSYQCNDNKFVVSDKVFTRNEFGLPDDAIVFCSFNNNWKITPSVFDSWMKILDKVPDSVLWIYVDNATAQANLRQEAKNRGIDPNRLVFATKIPLAEHLSRQRLADIFLDTFPYNAGATASNALRVGLPVITRSGESFASRYGSSLLHAVGMPELVTETIEEFESLAIDLATHPSRLAVIKDKLSNNLNAFPLFDTTRFARSLESAFVEMYQRSQSQLSPNHIFASR